MKYVPPYGRESEGDAAHYVNGNPVEGQRGSIPPAAAFEHPLREIVGVIEKSKFIADDADLLQLSKGVRSQRLNYAEDTGSANLLSVTYDPPISSYTLGLVLNVKVHTDNLGASTIDAGGGRVGIKTMAGFDTAAGDLRGGHIASLIFDGTYFQLINFFGQGGTGGPPTNNLVNIPYAVDVGITNVIEATFTTLTSTDYTLKAGDPFLVKIKNTNSSASIARFHIGGAFPDLGDKVIKANGGDTLLQGDVQVGDVVLFIYDGTQFWIQPNPTITADVTLSVPSVYADVPAALAAIRRKTIAQTATVTVLIDKASSGASPRQIAPFTINHANADRLVVRGVMQQPGAMTPGMFYQSGNTPALRAQDSANNILMLRSRYGVEVVVPGTTPPSLYAGAGVSNTGPGEPTIQDILVTGPNYRSAAPLGQWFGFSVDLARNIRTNNCSVWGCEIGWYGSGFFHCAGCFASGNHVNGWLITGPGGAGTSSCGAFGNTWGGMFCNQNADITTYICYANCNGQIGFGVGDNSQFTVASSQAAANGLYDLQAYGVSEMAIQPGSSWVTTTPNINEIGNYGAIIWKQY